MLFVETEELKKRRERLGLTQAQLAEILGVAETTVWRYEKGATAIPKYMDLVLQALEAKLIENLKKPIEND